MALGPIDSDVSSSRHDVSSDRSAEPSPQERAREFLRAGIDPVAVAEETGLSLQEIAALDNGGIGSIEPGLYADSSPEERSREFSDDSGDLGRLEGRRRSARHEDRYSGQSLDIRHIRPKHLNRHRA